MMLTPTYLLYLAWLLNFNPLSALCVSTEFIHNSIRLWTPDIGLSCTKPWTFIRKCSFMYWCNSILLEGIWLDRGTWLWGFTIIQPQELKHNSKIWSHSLGLIGYRVKGRNHFRTGHTDSLTLWHFRHGSWPNICLWTTDTHMGRIPHTGLY